MTSRWYCYEPQVMTDELDADELTHDQRNYLSWRRTEPPVVTLADAETLARRAFEHGMTLAALRDGPVTPA
jgi:hypothetical protein